MVALLYGCCGLFYVLLMTLGFHHALSGLELPGALLILGCMCAMLFSGLSASLIREKRREVDWRPRGGERHPPERDDTYPRFMLERSEDAQGLLMVGLSHWTYGSVWQREEEWAVPPRSFEPDAWEERLEWENRLRELGMEKTEQARLQFAEVQARQATSQQLLQWEGREELLS